MKKKYLLWIAMVAIGCMSCNNEWEDEQFTQLVSFKATLNSDGVSPIYVRYQTDGVKCSRISQRVYCKLSRSNGTYRIRSRYISFFELGTVWNISYGTLLQTARSAVLYHAGNSENPSRTETNIIAHRFYIRWNG